MKKIISLLMFICLCASLGHAQSQAIVLKNFDKWSFGINFSANQINGDATDKKSKFNLLGPKFGYGLTLSKQLSHFTGVEFNYSAGNLGLTYAPYSFSSKFKQFDGRFRVNFTNGQIIANYSKTQIYGFVGAGLMNYETTIKNESGDSTLKPDWVTVIPVGVGFKQRYSQKTSLNIEVGYNKVNTDRLDGYKVGLSENDGYINVKVGLQYTLGKKKKPLEWDEPLSYFKPSLENSVDTVVVIKKETIVIGDTTSKKPKEIKSLTIYYDTGDHLISGIYSEDLNKILNQLKNNPESYVEILAFCDSTGSEKTNNKLVVRRSRIVKDYFINNDVIDDRIHVYNYGMEFAKDPILSKDRKVIIKYWKNSGDKNNSFKQ